MQATCVMHVKNIIDSVIMDEMGIAILVFLFVVFYLSNAKPELIEEYHTLLPIFAVFIYYMLLRFGSRRV